MMNRTPFAVLPCMTARRVVLLALIPALTVSGRAIAQTVVGPERGALIVAGGGRLGPEIMNRFIDLAGGRDAHIVIMPGAGEQDSFPDSWSGYDVFREAGVRSVTVLHTRDRATADTESFADMLRQATGVWIPGGRQWRLADAYLDTRTLRALFAVLDRGGVIGGTSAGASIQASYMVRGAVEGNTIMMAEGHERGFGFLRNTAVDQHLLARGRENDLLAVIARYPELLGIGLDEGTAILVRGDRAEVIGRSKVAFYNTRDSDGDAYYFLEAGDVFDLAERRVHIGDRLPKSTTDARDVVATIEKLFEAMRNRDTAAVRAQFHPDARLYVTGQQSATPTLRVVTVDEFANLVSAAPDRLDERMRDPEIRLDGNLASVWTWYDFRRGDQFSHCGTDAFHLARTESGWKILQIAYTVRQQGCR
jgi:cyanophycinase